MAHKGSTRVLQALCEGYLFRLEGFLKPNPNTGSIVVQGIVSKCLQRQNSEEKR